MADTQLWKANMSISSDVFITKNEQTIVNPFVLQVYKLTNHTLTCFPTGYYGRYKLQQKRKYVDSYAN